MAVTRPSSRARSRTLSTRAVPAPRRRWGGSTWTSNHVIVVLSSIGSHSVATPTSSPASKAPHISIGSALST